MEPEDRVEFCGISDWLGVNARGRGLGRTKVFLFDLNVTALLGEGLLPRSSMKQLSET